MMVLCWQCLVSCEFQADTFMGWFLYNFMVAMIVGSYTGTLQFSFILIGS